MKCGTTSLHHCLSCHPQLALAPEKEVNFFFRHDVLRSRYADRLTREDAGTISG